LSDFYPLKPFRLGKRETLLQIISAYPLATLISGNRCTDDISLVPLMADVRRDGQMILTGHVDKNNPQAGKLVPGEPVAFVLKGPDA
jgi:predicted FMN-binding regulatory protein PaiB